MKKPKVDKSLGKLGKGGSPSGYKSPAFGKDKPMKAGGALKQTTKKKGGRSGY